MPDPNDQPGGAGGSGGGTPPAPPQKTVEERLKDMEEAQKRDRATLQTAQEELKRVNNLNGALMQRLSAGGGGNPPANGGGMDASRTVKLKRNFSEMDPAADPAGYATAIVSEVADQVRENLQVHTAEQNTQQELRKKFYDKNKDLSGFEIEVGHFSQSVQAEMPGATFEQAAEEVAKRTRDYVKSRGLNPNPADPNNPNPPPVLPANNAGGDGRVPIKPSKGGGSDKPFNADEEYANDMAEELKARNAERDRVGTKTGKA